MNVSKENKIILVKIFLPGFPELWDQEAKNL